jgi:nucleoside-diphosphate-sugar epimerase
MLKVLVTGANGFIGSHIVEALLKENYYITCIVRKTSNLKWIKNLPVEYKYGDLDDKDFLEASIKNIDIVIHCAGIVRAISKDIFMKVNVENTKNLCKSILKNNPKLKKFIFISSQAAIGPIRLNSIQKTVDKENPISDYGLSKLIAEFELKKIFYKKIPYTILRPSCVYGPSDKDIFIFFNLLNKHLRPTTITKRLLQLVYVKDVAKAVMMCLSNKKSDNNTYYLANSTIYTWSEIGKVISSSVNVKTIPLIVPDFIFRFIGLIAEIFSYITKKPVVLNKQKIIEILQKYWISDTKPIKDDLNIEFIHLEIASKITYNWYLKEGLFRLLYHRRKL